MLTFCRQHSIEMSGAEGSNSLKQCGSDAGGINNAKEGKSLKIY